MKSILLTTTAIVAFAGAAAADGHISIGWSGTATAGVAREGAVDAVSGAATIAGVLASNPDETRTAAEIETALNAADGPGTVLSEEVAPALGTPAVEFDPSTNPVTPSADAISNFETLPAGVDDGTDAEQAAFDAAAAANLAAYNATIGAATGSAAADAGDFDTYAEVNATVTGSVATDNGLTLSAAMSVDAGTGYDFADDDGFDATRTNGVGFDHVTLDAGTFGTLKFAPDDIAHLVDGDDDASVDVLYTNDFGVAKVSFALDIDTDTDDEAAREAWSVVNTEPTAGTFIDISGVAAVPASSFLTYVAPVTADVQWSVKVEAPVADIATVYAAFDEEGGYDVGATATVAGLTVKAKVKSEALAVAEGDDAEFDIHGSYTVSGLTVGAGWNSVEDDDQWRISGAYTMGAISVAASTDEGEDWEVTGSYDLGSGASLEAGVNYTEDAFVGVSFKF